MSFDERMGEIVDVKGGMVNVYRDRLDGLWIGIRWSKKNQLIHLKMNHLQIDNQLSITLFPTIVYPIQSKSDNGISLSLFVCEGDVVVLVGKSFIELCLLKSESEDSDVIQLKCVLN